jgi:hypothetical protein
VQQSVCAGQVREDRGVQKQAEKWDYSSGSDGEVEQAELEGAGHSGHFSDSNQAGSRGFDGIGVMKAIFRLTLACQALIGKLDGLPSTAQALESARQLEKTLRRALMNEHKNKNYWYELWRSTSLGHQNAQSLMANEIDSLAEMSAKMVEEIDGYREKLKIKSGPDWRSRLEKYKEGTFMDLLEKYRENFVRTNHPKDIDVPPQMPSVPSQL